MLCGTDDPLAPPGQPPAPVRYGAGLEVLVVGTGLEPFPSAGAPAGGEGVTAAGIPSRFVTLKIHFSRLR